MVGCWRWLVCGYCLLLIERIPAYINEGHPSHPVYTPCHCHKSPQKVMALLLGRDVTRRELTKECGHNIINARLAEPEDIEEACTFLASDTSSYMMGQSIQDVNSVCRVLRLVRLVSLVCPLIASQRPAQQLGPSLLPVSFL